MDASALGLNFISFTFIFQLPASIQTRQLGQQAAGTVDDKLIQFLVRFDYCLYICMTIYLLVRIFIVNRPQPYQQHQQCCEIKSNGDR